MMRMETVYRKRKACSALFVALLLAFVVVASDAPLVFADTLGTSSTAGLLTAYSPNTYIWFVRVQASSSGPLTSISLPISAVMTSPSPFGNVGIYADSSGVPGSLLAGGTAMSLSVGVNTFSSLSASVSIVSGTWYWLALWVVGSQFYYSSPGPVTPGPTISFRAWMVGTTACCTSMPTTLAFSSANTYAGTYALYGTYSSGPDFGISANPTSQSVGAGSAAVSTLSFAASGGFTGTVTLAVGSGCPPSPATCTLSASSVSTPFATPWPTLTVQTDLTTSAQTYSVVVTATSGSLIHTATFAVTVSAPGVFHFNVRSLATQIVVTVIWTGSGAANVAVANSTITFMDSAAQTYDRTSIVVVSGQTSSTSIIHRATFTAPSTFNGSGSNQMWTLYVAGPSSYTVTVEVT